MSKRNGKRRAWTSEHVRTLKVARPKENACGKHWSGAQEDRGRNAAKGFQSRIIFGDARLIREENYPASSPPHGGGMSCAAAAARPSCLI